MNSKIPIRSYRQLCPHTSVGTEKGEPLSVCPQPSTKCYIYVAPNQPVTIQSQLLATRWRPSKASYWSPQ